MTKKKIAIIGAGPAGLMAAEVLIGFGYAVEIFERMPTAGRKFLMAGRGGLNLTHSENADDFLSSYGPSTNWFEPLLSNFGQSDLRSWADGLGAETFVGSSGRVFPKAMKSSPLLRAWLGRLAEAGVELHLGQTWNGWDAEGNLVFTSNGSTQIFKPDATVLALGGASWEKLGSDGKWISFFKASEIEIEPFRPSNMGLNIDWSDILSEKYAGSALKNIGFSFNGMYQIGELMLTKTGIEGGIVYTFSSLIRDEIDLNDKASFALDLYPNLSVQEVAAKISKQSRKLSLSNKVRKALGLQGAKAALLEEVRRRDKTDVSDVVALAHLIKSLPLTSTSYQGLARSISSAGGVSLEALNTNLMLKRMPGVFACGEMLNWEAPTGGYLLQGCFSSAVSAARGLNAYLQAG